MLLDLWNDITYANEKKTKAKVKVKTPISGFGDCCAPKLLNFAARHGIRPEAIAEAWWGRAPPGGGRESGVLYDSCEDKCERILGFSLCGLDDGCLDVT